MTELFAKFNAINLEVQDDDLNLITTKSIISAFLKKTHFEEAEILSQGVQIVSNLVGFT